MLLQTSFFFCYMGMICYAFFLMLGAVGYRASLTFVRHIYRCGQPRTDSCMSLVSASACRPEVSCNDCACLGFKDARGYDDTSWTRTIHVGQI